MLAHLALSHPMGDDSNMGADYFEKWLEHSLQPYG